MAKNFFLKTFFLAAALAVVFAIIVMAANFKYTGTPNQQRPSQTLFEQFVIAGGPVVWFVLLPLSVVMVFLAAEYCLTIRRKKLVPSQIGRTIAGMIKLTGLDSLAEQVGSRDDLVSTAVLEALGKTTGDRFRIRSALTESLQNQALGLFRRIEWLNLIGNVSPMVGLFGTVFGMIKLFNAIVVAGGQPQPSHLAAGISVALVTTFWGLFIAIPALAMHGILRNHIETLVSDAAAEVEKIESQIGHLLRMQAGAHKPQQTTLSVREIAAGPAAKVNPSIPLK